MIEQLTHQSAENNFQQRIFTPLGMNSTTLPAPSSAAIPDPHPRGYMYGTNVGFLAHPELTGEQAAKADAAAGKPNDVTDANPSWTWTAGGAISTLHDMRIWARALATGQLLNAAMQKERLTWVPTGSAPDAPTYGLAIANFGGYIGHDGSIPGFQSNALYQPGKQITVVLLTNLYPAPDGASPANELAKIIIKQLSA